MPSDESKGSQLDAIGSLAQRQLDNTVCEAGGGEAKGGTARQGSAPATSGSSALRQYDDNGNGRITCAEARRHGIVPVRRGHPAYPYMRDADADGVVCER